ncbi:MAG: hypothetical protein ACOC31_00065 [Bacteroidota bacterium]
MSLSRVLSILLYILMAVSAVLVALFYFGGVVEGTEGTNLEEPVITNTILNWSYGLLIFAAIIAIIFPIVYLIMNPKNAKKALFAILGLGVVGLVAYMLADNSLLELTGYTGTDNNPNTLKWSGAGLIATYLLLGLAVVSILYSEIAKLFK